MKLGNAGIGDRPLVGSGPEKICIYETVKCMTCTSSSDKFILRAPEERLDYSMHLLIKALRDQIYNKAKFWTQRQASPGARDASRVCI